MFNGYDRLTVINPKKESAYNPKYVSSSHDKSPSSPAIQYEITTFCTQS